MLTRIVMLIRERNIHIVHSHDILTQAAA